MKTKIVSPLTKVPFEAAIWILGLILLACYNPHSDHWVSVCPLRYLEITFCPGCGLGRSISLLLHGAFRESLQTHPLGIFALIILISRIITLVKNNLSNNG